MSDLTARDNNGSVDELMLVFDWETRRLQHITNAMRKIFGPCMIKDLIGCTGRGLAFTFARRLYPNNPKAARAFYEQVVQTEKFFEENEGEKQWITSHAYEHDGRYYWVTMNFVRIRKQEKLVFLQITFKEISKAEFGELIEEKRQFETSPRMRREA
jgi:hypothetical protein